MAKAPRSNMTPSTACTVCCPLSLTMLDSCAWWAPAESKIAGALLWDSAIWDATMDVEVALIFRQAVIFQPLTAIFFTVNDDLECLSSFLRARFTTVLKMMSGRYLWHRGIGNQKHSTTAAGQGPLSSPGTTSLPMATAL